MLATGRDRTAYLEEIAAFTAAGFADRLAPVMRRAYEAGCTLPEVLAAIDAGKAMGEVPSRALRPAWQAAHDWAWIARRRPGPTNTGSKELPCRAIGENGAGCPEAKDPRLLELSAPR